MNQGEIFMVWYRHFKIALSSLSAENRERKKRGGTSNHLYPQGGIMRRSVIGALLSALVLAAVLLVACPAAGGGGASPNYICVNGTPSARSDATADGISRCLRCSPIATLEGTSDTIGATCRPLVEVGGAIRVSAATVVSFGVGETNPRELAAIGNTLYMVGATTGRLYTLNIDPADGTPDGSAIQVGSLAAGFGVGENTPTGLAAIGNNLYMVGASNDVLYTINTTDGMATQVGGLAAGFGVGENNNPFGLAAIGNTLYMVGATHGRLYTLNIDPADTISDGSADQVGSLAAGFGVDELGTTGLATVGNTLYMVGQSNRVLYSLNIDSADTISDGSADQVGSLAAGFGVGEGGPTGLAAIGNTLYMVGQNNDVLYALRYQ